MQLIQEPTQELDRVADLRDLEPLPTRVRALLEQLVRTNLSLERLGVPDLPEKHREPPDEFRCFGGRRRRVEDEQVAQGGHVREREEDRVHPRVGFDVVEADETGVVRREGKREGGGRGRVDAREERGREGRVEEVLDVVERGVRHFVPVGEDVDLVIITER